MDLKYNLGEVYYFISMWIRKILFYLSICVKTIVKKFGKKREIIGVKIIVTLYFFQFLKIHVLELQPCHYYEKESQFLHIMVFQNTKNKSSKKLRFF
jgi:hypothetical protein